MATSKVASKKSTPGAAAGKSRAASAALPIGTADAITEATSKRPRIKALEPEEKAPPPAKKKAAKRKAAPDVQVVPDVPVSAEEPAKKDGAEKKKKVKLVRDSFAMPESEYFVIAALKKRCLSKGMAVKKSEVLRAAITTLASLSDAEIGEALAKVVPIKTGRPPKPAR